MHTFNSKGHGLYIQPLAGYTFGHTAIPSISSSGQPATNAQGDTFNRKGKGVTAGLALGYNFSKKNSDYSIELRYERVFVTGDLPIAMLAIRYVYTVTLGRRR
jgi:hypothetical protein